MESDPGVAQQQLEELDRAREALRERAMAPRWYYVALGVALTGLPLILVLPDDEHWWPVVALFGIVVLLSHLDARVRGLHTELRERSRWVMVLWFVGGGAVSYPLYVLSQSVGRPVVIVPVALLCGVGAALAAWRGDRAFAARLEGDQS
ncbi:MAG: hypothetical protein ACXWDM_15830 [Nocardioides sp.]